MKLVFLVIAALVFVVAYVFFQQSTHSDVHSKANFPTLATDEIVTAKTQPGDELELATFGSGCYWCTEAVFQQLKGVYKVESGFSGGSVKNPTYHDVCTGTTGHAEVVQITFDPKVITYPELLEAFWRSHDPTTLNRQGYDSGTQYRSVIFTHSQRQKELAERYKKKINDAGVFSTPVVTEITSFKEFYPAMADHQNYFANNPNAGYCRAVIAPKMDKFKAIFKDKLKGE